MITNDSSLTRDIKSGIVIAKSALNKKRVPFTGKLSLNLRMKIVHATV